MVSEIGNGGEICWWKLGGHFVTSSLCTEYNQRMLHFSCAWCVFCLCEKAMVTWRNKMN